MVRILMNLALQQLILTKKVHFTWLLEMMTWTKNVEFLEDLIDIWENVPMDWSILSFSTQLWPLIGQKEQNLALIDNNWSIEHP